MDFVVSTNTWPVYGALFYHAIIEWKTASLFMLILPISVLTLAYTLSNVPYSALMGVMTPCEKERTNLSGYRFAGAFGGGLLVMGFLPDLVAYFGDGNDAIGYQYTMYVFCCAADHANGNYICYD